MLNAIDQIVPKTFHSNSFPRWFSKELRSLVKETKRLHKFNKSFGNNVEYIEFSTVRKKSKVISQYLERIQSSLSNNPKYFWKFVKYRQKTNIIPSNTTSGDTTTMILKLQ